MSEFSNMAVKDKIDTLQKFFDVYCTCFKRDEAKGNVASAESSICYAILSLQAMAVLECNTSSLGAAYIKSKGGVELLEKSNQLADQLPPEKEFTIFVTVGVAHCASLMGRHEIAEHYIARSQQTGRHFWNEYARAMQCLVTKQSYEPKLGKIGGSQKYWAAYLPFISDVTNGRDFSGSLEALRQSFEKRIKDKRITDDGGLILEGSGHNPTHWDFRTEGLKAYVTYKYGLTFSS